MTASVRPPLTYHGGKSRLAAQIARLLPAHRHYVEPYAGSLAVLLAKPPSAMETVNDLDGDVMLFWRVLRDRPADLARVCALTPHSRAEFETCADLTVGDELERARRIWVRLTQSRAAPGLLFRTGWRHHVDPSAAGTPMPGYLDAYVERMAAAAARLHSVSLECRPAVDLIARYGVCDAVLLYVDPPYLGSTRGNGRSYRHELLTDTEHRELADVLHRCRAAVVLSGYPSTLYDAELYPAWHRHEITSGTGQGPGSWSRRTEVFWSNRPLHVHPTLFGSDVAIATTRGGRL